MELKNETNEISEYGTKQSNSISGDISTSNKKKMTPLKKWGIVGATLVVAGIVTVCACCCYNIAANADYEGSVNVTPSVSVFNSQFERFFGSPKFKTITKNLIRLVIANNGANFMDHKVKIIIKDDSFSGLGEEDSYEYLVECEEFVSKIRNLKFNIEGIYDEQGYINKIISTPVQKSSSGDS